MLLRSVAVKEWGWLDDSPMRKVSKPKEPRGRVRFLDDEEDLVGQATDDDLRDALDRLGDREEKIQTITRDIVLGKNK